MQTGHSIIQVDLDYQRSPNGGTGVEIDAAGEAVIVDLGSRGRLFVLLSSPTRQDWASTAAASLTSRAPADYLATAEDVGRAQVEWRHKQLELAKQSGTSFEVPRIFDRIPRPAPFYPYMVRFRDTRDPSTIEVLDPDRLEQAFGEGVRFKRLIITPTDESPESRIEQVLPWVKAGSWDFVPPVPKGTMRGPGGDAIFHASFKMGED